MGREGLKNRVADIKGWSRRQKITRIGGVVTVVGFVVLLAVVPMSILGLVVNDTTSMKATPATPTDSALNKTGYELETDDVVVKDRHTGLGTVHVRSPRHVYQRTVEVQNRTVNAGVFVVLSSPAVRIAGSAQNPLASETDTEILSRFADQFTNESTELTFEKTGNREVVVLGEATTLSKFRTTMTVGGIEREMAVYLAVVRSEGNIVVTIGTHPTAFAGERVSILRLLYSVNLSFNK